MLSESLKDFVESVVYRAAAKAFNEGETLEPVAFFTVPRNKFPNDKEGTGIEILIPITPCFAINGFCAIKSNSALITFPLSNKTTDQELFFTALLQCFANFWEAKNYIVCMPVWIDEEEKLFLSAGSGRTQAIVVSVQTPDGTWQSLNRSFTIPGLRDKPFMSEQQEPLTGTILLTNFMVLL